MNYGLLGFPYMDRPRTPSGTIVSTSESNNVLVVTGTTETLLPGMDRILYFPGASVLISWSIWISQNAPSSSKSCQLLLRRTSVNGPLLSLITTFPDVGDSSLGHQAQSASSFTDNAPTDGRYILSVKYTGGGASPQVWSDTRVMSIKNL